MFICIAFRCNFEYGRKCFVPGCFCYIFNTGLRSSNRRNANYFDYDQDKYIYETTTKFPKFNAESKYDLVEALQNKGIKDVFSSNADFSPISNTDLSCSQVIHSTKLGVDRKGIIGAAMTYVMTDGAAAPDRRTKIHEEFIVDRAFGYLVSDRYNRIIFSGIINKI